MPAVFEVLHIVSVVLLKVRHWTPWQVDLPKGYAYVDFEKRGEAEEALSRMNGGQIDGNTIKLEFVYIPSSKPGPPRLFRAL